MAAKAAKGAKQRKRAMHDDKRKAQASLAVEKRVRGMKGRNAKAQLEQLTAELDMRTAEVHTAYMKSPTPHGVAVSMGTYAPVEDLAEALRGL